MTNRCRLFSDTEAQIARCHDRIKEKIMPRIFEWKLKDLEQNVKNRVSQFSGQNSWECADGLWLSAMMARGLALGRATVQRLADLEGTKAWFTKHGDRYTLLSSVIGIIAAYRSKKPSWTPDRVTFWSYGRSCQSQSRLMSRVWGPCGETRGESRSLG